MLVDAVQLNILKFHQSSSQSILYVTLPIVRSGPTSVVTIRLFTDTGSSESQLEIATLPSSDDRNG
jgi:hypothetical protein